MESFAALLSDENGPLLNALPKLLHILARDSHFNSFYQPEDIFQGVCHTGPGARDFRSVCMDPGESSHSQTEASDHPKTTVRDGSQGWLGGQRGLSEKLRPAVDIRAGP